MPEEDYREHDCEINEIQSSAETTLGRGKIGPCGNASFERIFCDLTFLDYHMLPPIFFRRGEKIQRLALPVWVTIPFPENCHEHAT
ncbi:hypothetical protein BTM_1601 [Burkholderia thailandensis 34]|nr:hypothetical protein BTM_1601 [Burkholderia thailandensis 34]AOJ55447.1 hypothetical protein AQ477_02235 [Burkholderia thailandensis]KXF60551.1 hypothetical protein AQ476_04095 [Burkholderia thailandensis]PNE75393.1 hypothetical protein A8H37_27555 [Burkholderia thailandensis]